MLQLNFCPVAVLRRWVGLWLALGLTLVSSLAGTPAGNDYLIDVWRSENGLPNNSVTSVAQTPDGYLWIGTYKGLARFDGIKFVTFSDQDTPELLNARIRKLFLDAQGTLWINTFDGSLTSWRGGKFRLEWRAREYADSDAVRVASDLNHLTILLATGDLIRRDFNHSNADWQWITNAPSKGPRIAAVEDGSGTLWYRNRENQLLRLVGSEFEVVSSNRAIYPEGARARTLTLDRHGRLLVATETGALVLEDGKFNFIDLKTSPAPDVTFIFATKQDALWMVVNGRLRKFEGGKWAPDVDTWDASLTGTMVMRLGGLQQSDGSTWLYQYGQGLISINAAGAVHRFSTDEGFPGDRVDCLFEDSEGNLWAGVNRGGLVRLRKKRFQVLSGTESGQLVGMYSVCEDASGVLWLGTDGNGLGRWQNEKYSLSPNVRGYVFSTYPSKNGDLWVSTGEEDLFVLTRGRLERCTPWVHGVKSLLASRDEQTVWAGTKIGLFVCTNAATRAFAPLDGFPRTNDVRALVESKDGVLWAGGGDGVLYRVDKNGVESINPNLGEPRYPIWSLLAEADGTVWVGTFRGGLLRYRDGKFDRLSISNGLPDNVIAQLLADDKGHLWIGSQQGIFRAAKADLEACAAGRAATVATTAYGRWDGLPTLECSGLYQPACWHARDGRLWFSTVAGAVSIQPNEAEPNLRPPPVVIEDVLVDDVPQKFVAFTGKSGPVLEIPPGNRQFEFRYTGLSFVSPDRVRFRYQLEGLEKKWIEAGGQRSVKFNYIRPGEYTFRVTACNNEGVWNPVSQSVRLHVQPHFYETKTFTVGAIAGGVGMVLLFARAIYRRRLRAELERIERQRAVERDRARIAKDIHDDLGAGLTQITLLSELAKRDTPEEIPEHVGQISSTARELTRAMDEIVWAINPQNDTLEGLITYISKFAQQYLTLAGIRCRLDVPTELPTLVLGAEVRHNLYLAIKETLNNIVKHSGATLATLRLECSSEKIELSIADDGRGIERGEPSPASRERTSSGHGLANIARRLEDIGGRCEVSSSAGKGTTIRFNIPARPGTSPVLATGPEKHGE
ncbi:MAG: hypothetical protein RLY20_2289 [Verrucomicrobiota bacterium]|jgi:signal transduction histidine kinase/ligand-binding sensor domain-containing protein